MVMARQQYRAAALSGVLTLALGLAGVVVATVRQGVCGSLASSAATSADPGRRRICKGAAHCLPAQSPLTTTVP